MGITYMCPFCHEQFGDVVQANEHKRECPERPLSDLGESS